MSIAEPAALSRVVCTLFAFALSTAGPPMIWSFLIAGLGQLLVALVFSEIVSQYVVAASIRGPLDCGVGGGRG